MKKFLIIFTFALVAMASCTSKPVATVAEPNDSTEFVVDTADMEVIEVDSAYTDSIQ